MPTILREAGFEVRIYTFDHQPPHVDVQKAGAVLRIDLRDGASGADRRRDFRPQCERAEQIVAKHAAVLKEAWRTLHGRE